MKKLITTLLLLSAGFAQASDLVIADGYARVATPTAKTGAAFMMIDNPSDETLHLTGVSSDVAARVELHTHKANEDGVMMMTEVEEGIMIAPNSCLLLERGGYHVMFMGIKAPFEDGREIPFVLEFADQEPVEVIVKVDSAHEEPAERMLPEGRENCQSAKMMHDMTGDDEMSHDKMDHDKMDHGDMKEGEEASAQN